MKCRMLNYLLTSCTVIIQLNEKRINRRCSHGIGIVNLTRKVSFEIIIPQNSWKVTRGKYNVGMVGNTGWYWLKITRKYYVGKGVNSTEKIKNINIGKLTDLNWWNSSTSSRAYGWYLATGPCCYSVSQCPVVMSQVVLLLVTWSPRVWLLMIGITSSRTDSRL